MRPETTTIEHEATTKPRVQCWWLPSVVTFNVLIWIGIFVRTVWFFVSDENRQGGLSNCLPYWLPAFAILIISFYEYLSGVRFRDNSIVIISRVIGAFFLTPGIIICVAWTYSPFDPGAKWFIGMFLNYVGLCFVHAKTWHAFVAAKTVQNSDSTEL